MYLQRVVDDRPHVAPHQADAASVVAGAALAPRVVEQLVVALHLQARQALFPDERPQCGRGENPPGRLQTAEYREYSPLPAGIGDMATELMALPAALGLAAGKGDARRAAIAGISSALPISRSPSASALRPHRARFS